MITQINLSFQEQCAKFGYINGVIVCDVISKEIEKLKREKEGVNNGKN